MSVIQAIEQEKVDKLVAAAREGWRIWKPTKMSLFTAYGEACAAGAMLSGLDIEEDFLHLIGSGIMSLGTMAQDASIAILNTVGIDPGTMVYDHDGNVVSIDAALYMVFDSMYVTVENYFVWLASLAKERSE